MNMTHTSMAASSILEWDTIHCRKHVTGLIKELTAILTLNDIKSVVVVDVGANIGKFTELLLDVVIVDDAILIEPVLELLEYAKLKFAAPKFSKFKYDERLITDEIASYSLYTPLATSENLGISRIITHHTGDSSEIRELQSTTLSALLAEHGGFTPSLIKIDAEGYDIPAVRGLFKYLQDNDNRPIIIFEVAGNVEPWELVEAVKIFGYRYYCNYPDGKSRDIFLLPQHIRC
jgi:FkbM family methyltransferase